MNQTLLIKGEWTNFSLAEHITGDHPVVQRLRDIARGKYKRKEGEKIIRDLKNKKILRKVTKNTNTIPTVGRNVLTRLLTGDATYSGEINYIALGSGNTPFTLSSTTLNTEVFRKLVSDASYDENIAYIDVFIESGDVADDTYPEGGGFIDGTPSADSGQAFSLVVQDFVKSGSMFISLKITFSQTGD